MVNVALGAVTLSFSEKWHTIAVKTCCVESDLVKQSFLTLIPPYPALYAPSLLAKC